MFLKIYVVILLLNTWAAATSGKFPLNEFNKITPQHCGPKRLASTWVDRSRSACAFSCLARHTNCQGFMYNEVTKLCTPSSGLSSEQPIPTSQEGEFYFSDSCQSYPDFSVKSNQSTTAYVAYYYRQKLNYTNAMVTCQCMDSQLYVANTLEKLWLINDIVDKISVFIGLDDMAVEGQFVWADSGQVINESLKKEIFAPNQPDDYHGEQDCVFRPYDQILLDDGPCSMQKAFICEKTLC